MARITEFSGQIPLFFEAFLNKPASALPKGAQWVVDFEGLADVKEAIKQTCALEPQKWNIDGGLDLLIDNEDYNKKGCLFCQAVSVPGEQAIANPQGIQKNQFIRTAVGDGRSDYTPTGLRMVFLDTNISFVDNVIRPWVLTTARLGLVARPKGPTNYRQTITVYKIGVLTPADPPFVLQKYIFNGACPIEVSAEEYNYAPQTGPLNRDATFIFHSYSVDNGSNNLAITRNNETFKPADITSIRI